MFDVPRFSKSRHLSPVTRRPRGLPREAEPFTSGGTSTNAVECFNYQVLFPRLPKETGSKAIFGIYQVMRFGKLFLVAASVISLKEKSAVRLSGEKKHLATFGCSAA
jgi:hypothetical protein